MDVPFTTEAFLNVFREYNTGVWPAQIAAIIIALACIITAVGGGKPRGAVIGALLGLLWLWMGIVYHIIYFSTINPAATIFGAAFILQGVLFLHAGIIRRELEFRIRRDASSITGMALIVFALLLYPIIGTISGHAYPASPTFGLPCPTTIFTFGMLLTSDVRVPRRLLVVPALWSLLGSVAAIQFGIVEDMGLILSGVVATTMLLLRDRRRASEHPLQGSLRSSATR